MTTETITIGRRLDDKGMPIEGTGVLLNIQSLTAKLLLAKQTIILSNPVTGEYGAQVEIANEKNEPVAKGLGIIPPGSIGPPEHIHPSYDEIFTVVEGSFEFLVNKKIKSITEGETIIVPKGVAHTFKPADKTKICSFLVEAQPKGKLQEVIRTIWGLAHDGKTNSKGQPKEFWQGIAIGSELQNDTLFASPPPSVQHLLFKLFAKTAFKKGYKGIYEKYEQDSFWTTRIEQLRQKGLSN